MWFAGLVRLALGGFLFGSSACRAAPPSPPKPVHLSVGFADTGLYNRDTGIAVLVSQLEDERLIRLSADGRFEPALAERWEQSPDGLAWTFFLRRGLTFHNGMPLDAQAATARLRQPIVSGSSPGFRDVLSVEARGPLELVIRLRRPSRFVLDALAVQSIRSSGPNSAGAGPFRATSQQKDRASLSAFSGYYRGKPAISQVDIRPYRDGRNAWSALMRGEIDFLFEVSPDALDFVKGSSATQVKSFIRQHLYTLGFNMRHPVLRERAVRVALSEAVNRDEIVKVQFGGRGAAATSMLWPKHWAYDAHLPMFGYAPMDAGRLLDAAGLVVKPAVDRRMPSRFRFTCLLPESDARFERMALMLQRQFIEVGVDMQLEPVSMGTLVQRLGTGQYEAFLFEVLAHDLDWVYTFWHSPEGGAATLIDSGYRGADVALDRVRAARTDDDTRAAVAELQRVMHDEPPAVSICWSQTARAVSGRFRLPEVIDRDIWPTLWQWQPVPDGPAASTASVNPLAR